MGAVELRPVNLHRVLADLRADGSLPELLRMVPLAELLEARTDVHATTEWDSARFVSQERRVISLSPPLVEIRETREIHSPDPEGDGLYIRYRRGSDGAPLARNEDGTFSPAPPPSGMSGAWTLLCGCRGDGSGVAMCAGHSS